MLGVLMVKVVASAVNVAVMFQVSTGYTRGISAKIVMLAEYLFTRMRNNKLSARHAEFWFDRLLLNRNFINPNYCGIANRRIVVPR